MRLRQWQPAGRLIGPTAAVFLVVGTLATVVRGVPIAPILGISEYGDADTVRYKVLTRLSATPGQHVVFVSYGRTHGSGDEWVYNRADVDAARIVWCRAIGPEEDARVMRYFAGRRFWLAEVELREARVRRLLPPGGPPVSEDARETEEWVVAIKPRTRWPAPLSPFKRRSGRRSGSAPPPAPPPPVERHRDRVEAAGDGPQPRRPRPGADLG
jgi:hypothetical protein